MVARDEFATKADLKELKEEIILEFRLFLERVKRVLSSNNLSPKREHTLTGLESQVKKLQEWRKRVQARLPT